MNNSIMSVGIIFLLAFVVSCNEGGMQKPSIPEKKVEKTEKMAPTPGAPEKRKQGEIPKDASPTPHLTEAEVTAYGNRAVFFDLIKSKSGVERCPDLDWRGVLADWLSKEEPKYSQGLEELVIRDYFRDVKGGFFVDVGCWLPDEGSTTAYLEHDLHWKGIGIDVVAEYGEAWKKFRPNSIFVCSAISDKDGEKLKLFVDGWLATFDSETGKTFQKKMMGKTGEMQEIEVTTTTINTLLEQNGVDAVDFLSIDIEGTEPAALKGFDIQRYKPALCCIEANKMDPVMEYFAANGYELIEKYRKLDKINLYFRPVKPESQNRQQTEQ